MRLLCLPLFIPPLPPPLFPTINPTPRCFQVTGASDPYAVLSVGPSAASTGFIMNTLNPKWGQRLLLYVRDIEKDMLKVGGRGLCVSGGRGRGAGGRDWRGT